MKSIKAVGPKKVVTYEMPDHVFWLIQVAMQVSRQTFRRKTTIEQVIDALPDDIRKQITSTTEPLSREAGTRMPAMIWLYEKLVGHKELLDTAWHPGKVLQEREIKKWHWN